MSNFAKMIAKHVEDLTLIEALEYASSDQLIWNGETNDFVLDEVIRFIQNLVITWIITEKKIKSLQDITLKMSGVGFSYQKGTTFSFFFFKKKKCWRFWPQIK